MTFPSAPETIVAAAVISCSRRAPMKREAGFSLLPQFVPNRLQVAGQRDMADDLARDNRGRSGYLVLAAGAHETGSGYFLIAAIRPAPPAGRRSARHGRRSRAGWRPAAHRDEAWSGPSAPRRRAHPHAW